MTRLETVVSDDFAKEIERIVNKSGKTVGDALGMFVEDIVYERQEIVGERIMPTDEYMRALLCPIASEMELISNGN